ncbi:MAG: hypothetical protein HF312_02580 [Ignavibacteria bacterium]|jgi:hypothetical protein|nr:hypothetical protein [Ignavibacteria bacterium]MCU7519072.1 hypothetical protein [Ignavibacteria bacterium]
MVTKEEFDKIQRLLDQRYKQKPEAKEFAFTGAIKCAECGSSITAEDKVKHQKNGNVHSYTYYHCTKKLKPDCSQKTVEVKSLEAQISDVLESITIPEDFISWAMEMLKKDAMKSISDRKNLLKAHRTELSVIQRNVDKLIDLKLSGTLSDSEFLQKKAQFKDREIELQALVSKLEKDESADMESVESLMRFGQAANEAFKNGTIEQKRMILKSLGSNLLLKDRKLIISLEKPILLIKEINDSLKGNEAENSPLEPVQVPIKKGTYSDSITINPLVLREQGSNLQPFG